MGDVTHVVEEQQQFLNLPFIVDVGLQRAQDGLAILAPDVQTDGRHHPLLDEFFIHAGDFASTRSCQVVRDLYTTNCVLGTTKLCNL